MSVTSHYPHAYDAFLSTISLPCLSLAFSLATGSRPPYLPLLPRTLVQHAGNSARFTLPFYFC